MANNLYTATETLLAAYRDALESQPYNRIQLYANLMGFKKPTTSEMLLGCITPVATVYDSKKSLQRDDETRNENDSKTVNYILDNVLSKVNIEEPLVLEEYPEPKTKEDVDALLDSLNNEPISDSMKPLEPNDINLDDNDNEK